ncbi:MAG: choice-of-anchor V domain-containing protein, partial [Chitinophagales bacterium]
MKKNKVVKLFLLILTLIISAGIYESVLAKEDGAPSGNTGSPGDDGQTCAHVDCHTGSASNRDGLITTDVPASGYLSTETYLITVTIEEADVTKFGFSASPQDLDGSKMGEIELINTIQTKETGGGKYITHTLSGTA